ncbi:hypothetical protein N2152v2_010157 [Parachlorella kessleri]
MEALPTRLVEEGNGRLDCPSDDSHQNFVENSFEQQVYSFAQIDGEYTLQQLVAMDLAKAPLLKKVRRRDLPEAFWEARRRALNRRRTQRQKQARKERVGEHRCGEEDSAGRQCEDGRTEVEKQQAIQAHLDQQRRVEQALQHGLRVAVDCSLCPPGAAGREVRSLAKQLQLCVGANKRARAPLSLHFVGFAGPVAGFAVGRMNALRWPAVHLKEAPALEVFPPEQVVLLSPDAEEPLLELDPSKVYVIGGLVDRSAQKHATATFAQQQGIACARLPTQEFLEPAPQAQHGQPAEQHSSSSTNGCDLYAGVPAQPGRQSQGLGRDWGQVADADVGRTSLPTLTRAALHPLQQLGHDRERQQQQQQGQQQPEQPPALANGRAAGSQQPGRKEGSLILNINDVVDILLAVNAGEGWGEALRRSIPQRKQQQKFGSRASLVYGTLAQPGATAAEGAETALGLKTGLARLAVCDGH